MKRIFFLLLCSQVVYSQTENSATQPFTELSPRQSIQEFMQAINRDDFEHAQKYLEFSRSINNEQRKAMMQQVFYTLDQVFQLNVYGLSPDPKGYQNDEIPFDREVLYSQKVNNQMEIYFLQRFENQSERKVYWRIDYPSVTKMQNIATRKVEQFFEKYVPSYLKFKILKLPAWQWVGIFIAILSSLLLSFLTTSIFLKTFSWLINKKESSSFTFSKLARPLQILLFVAILEFFIRHLNIGFAAREIFYMCQRILTLFSAVWILFIANDIFFKIIQWRSEKEGKTSIIAVLPLIKKLTLITIAILGGLFTLQNLGYNVSALIAGLGVGGIAIALAGQKTIENLLGGFMILLDQPIKVNDFGRYGDMIGTVESIGLRSVRIRTLDRTVVTVPNAEFAQMNIENFAKRDRIRFFMTLGVRYESSSEQLCYILSEVRKLFLAHEKVDNEPGRIRFVNFAAYSLDLEIFAYILTDNFGEYLAIKEDLLLSIKQIVEDSGTEFAFPSQTIYWERSEGLDQEKTIQTNKVVNEWKSNGRFPLPEFPSDVIAEFSNTRKYPSNDSWLRNINNA